MAKHLKAKPKNTYLKKIGVPVLLTGLMMTTSGAAIAAEPMTQTQALQIVSKAGAQIKPATLINLQPVITASKDAKISFASPVVTSKPAPAKVVTPVEAPVETPEAPAPVQAATNPANVAPAALQAAPVAVAAPTATQSNAAPVAGSTSARIASAALAQIGVNQDCTMLVTNALANVGINFHGWPAGYLALGTVTSNPVPGDLIYYADGGMGMAHIAVFIGNNSAVHGGWNGNETRIGPTNLGSGPVYIHIA